MTLKITDKVAHTAAAVWSYIVFMDRAGYLRWHPADHIDFREITPAATSTGLQREVFFRERIGSRTFAFSCRITESIPGRYVEFHPRGALAILRAGRGYFRLDASDDGGTTLESVVELGWRLPLFGRLIDAAIARLLNTAALEKHMREEAAYLAAAVPPPLMPRLHRVESAEREA